MLKFSPIHPLPKFYKLMGWSRSSGERPRRTDPDFPPLIEIGINRQGVREADAAKYQDRLRKRAAAAPKENAFDAQRARAAARISIDVRRAKRDAKKQTQAAA